MRQAKIIEKEFNFRYSLEERSYTDMIVIHHTGCNDYNAPRNLDKKMTKNKLG